MPLTRNSADPLLTPRGIPALRPDLRDVSSVFNPGAARWRGRDLLLLRVQTRGRTTVLLPAEHRADGRVEFLGNPVAIPRLNPEPAHVYDPRLSVLDGAIYAVCACDFADGCRLLTLRSNDFESWELVALEVDRESRNGVLFPERIGGRYLRLDRPNETRADGEPATGDTIVLSESDDLKSWRVVAPILEGRPQRWDERIGSGPPPLKTRAGWLHLYHGVATHFGAANIYQAGVQLLDLADPSQVVARGAFNVLEPRTAWELTGQVPNVVFPSGWIADDVDDDGFAREESRVRVYYGAADSVVGLATATVAELIEDAQFSG